ncbi:MAG: hypothetical protein DU429_08880 [Candidatus Tokpelaia sp.]|nr:MAG: hypothetical protein DU429_08880 [Candidatus Tokpelaia sp.]
MSAENLNKNRMASIEAVLNDALQILESCKNKTASSFCRQDIAKLVKSLEKKHFSSGIKRDSAGIDTASEAFKRKLKNNYRNSEDRVLYNFLQTYILGEPFPFSWPVAIIKQESPDFVIKDKHKTIAIECTQLMSDFEAEHCIPYQSAVIEAFCQGEPPPNKKAFGIDADIGRTGRTLPFTDGVINIFTLPNKIDATAIIAKAKKLIEQKESKAETYKENGDFDAIYLLIYVRGMSAVQTGKIEKAVKASVVGAFNALSWLSDSGANKIEIHAPYDSLA